MFVFDTAADVLVLKKKNFSFFVCCFLRPKQAVKSLIEDINEEIDVQAQEEEFKVTACAPALLLCVCVRSDVHVCTFPFLLQFQKVLLVKGY